MNTEELHAITIISENQKGVLRDLAGIMVSHDANIQSTQQSIIPSGPEKGLSTLYFEFEDTADVDGLMRDLRGHKAVRDVIIYQPFSQIFGKRVIIMGGGVQVAQVAMGAVNEADRHNIRGERISVDTIPLVGESGLRVAVDAVSRLPRASVLVLAGSLMGGEISEAVTRVREAGIPVISLSMAGTVPEHADLVVTDPVQAGVFAVMHVSSLAVFSIDRVRGRRF